MRGRTAGRNGKLSGMVGSVTVTVLRLPGTIPRSVLLCV
jgi:hypothetical protein